MSGGTPSGTGLWLDVCLDEQQLRVLDSTDRCLRVYPVSTARVGPDQRRDSGGTPLGWHCIRARIGAGLPLRAVLRGRRPTGEICDDTVYRQSPERDWILTRILWLSGLEPGFNRLGQVDTFRRYIYIHGTPDAVRLGVPGSKGCIRMANAALVELFDRVRIGTRVRIRVGADPGALS